MDERATLGDSDSDGQGQGIDRAAAYPFRCAILDEGTVCLF